MRKLILGMASVLALGIGGAALDFTADADNSAAKAGLSDNPASGAPRNLAAANLSKDDVRWAQLELRNMGLYNGSLDGVVGPQTRRALAQFQKDNGLDPTAMLDQQTVYALTGDLDVGQGSSIPPNPERVRSMRNSSGAGNSGE